MLNRLRIPAAYCPPEAAAVIGAVYGIIAWQCPQAALFGIPALLLPLCRIWIFAGFALAAAISGAIHSAPPEASAFPHRVQAALCITDLGLSRLPDMPVPALAEARPIRLTGPVILPVPDRIGIRFPKGFAGHPAAGDIVCGSGILSIPRGKYGEYLAGRGIRAVLALDECRFAGRQLSWRSRLADLRDRLLGHAVRGIEQGSIRREAASLFFGIKGGLDRASRRELVNAGVIHLYSVSGLHVGILSAVLLLLFRPVPFRLRYLLLIPLTLLYVLSTGANVPAVRAWIMIAVWAGCRSMLRWMPVRTVLGYSAAGMVIFQPAWIGDMGFLYSFGITLVLILLGDALRDMRSLGLDPAGMMPRSGIRRNLLRKLHFRNRLLNAGISCTAAFIGGAAVSLGFQNRLLPGSVPANLLLMPAVGLLFPVMALKISLAGISPGMDQLLGKLLTWLWHFMETAAELVSQSFPATVTGVPSWWSLALLITGVLLLLGPPLIRHSRLAGVLFIGSVLAYWHGSMAGRTPAVMIAHGGFAEVPAAAIADTAAGTGCIVNVPDAASAAAMAEFFLAHGIAEVDRVCFSAPRSAHMKGLPTLMMRIPVRQAVIPADIPHSHAFRARLRAILAEAPDTGECTNLCNLVLSTRPDSWSIRYHNPASGLRVHAEFSSAPESVTFNGKRTLLIRSSEPQTLIYPL